MRGVVEDAVGPAAKEETEAIDDVMQGRAKKARPESLLQHSEVALAGGVAHLHLPRVSVDTCQSGSPNLLGRCLVHSTEKRTARSECRRWYLLKF